VLYLKFSFWILVEIGQQKNWQHFPCLHFLCFLYFGDEFCSPCLTTVWLMATVLFELKCKQSIAYFSWVTECWCCSSNYVRVAILPSWFFTV